MRFTEVTGDDYCFACGPRNPIGLKLVFNIDAEAKTSHAAFVPRPEHQGYVGVTHGGILSTVLDEAMIKLCWSLGIPAVTAKLEVRLKRPAAVGEGLEVWGRIDEDRGRTLMTSARITDHGGAVIAEAKATAVVSGRRTDQQGERR